MAKHKLEQNSQHINKTQCPNNTHNVYHDLFVLAQFSLLKAI